MSETKSKTTSKQTEKSTSKSTSTSQSSSSQLTKNVLDSALRDEILAGLLGVMSDEEISRYAEALLRPQLNAGLEASQQAYETTKLAKEQEIENLAAMLSQSIDKQNAAYRTSMADIETAALARGMGRSSYTLETLAKQGNALMEAVRQLTDESNRQQGQIQAQITQAAQQNAQTQNRLNTDYAANVLAKTEEIRRQQREDYNRNYLTATSTAMGQSVTGSQTGSQTGDTTNSSTSDNTSSTTTKVIGAGSGGGGGGGSSSSSSKKTTGTLDTETVRAINGRYSGSSSGFPNAQTSQIASAAKKNGT